MLHRRPWLSHLAAVALLAAVAWTTAHTGLAGRTAAGLAPLRGFAYAALCLLCLALALGPLARLVPRWFGALLPARRAAGIWCAVAAGLHLWYALEYLKTYGRNTLRQVFFAPPTVLGFSVPRGPTGWTPDLTPTGIACWLGLFALAGMALLALTSSDPAQRWLGQASWKWVHGRVYGIFALVLLHFALVSLAPLKGSPARLTPFWYVAAATALLQVGAFVKTTLGRRR